MKWVINYFVIGGTTTDDTIQIYKPAVTCMVNGDFVKMRSRNFWWNCGRHSIGLSIITSPAT